MDISKHVHLPTLSTGAKSVDTSSYGKKVVELHEINDKVAELITNDAIDKIVESLGTNLQGLIRLTTRMVIKVQLR